MGDRAQVKVVLENKSIYLYTHWDGSELENIVISALKRGSDRLDDPEYLARIIFSEMIKDDIMGSTGYGIGNHQHGDVHRVVIVDCDNQILIDFNGKKYSFSQLWQAPKGAKEQ